MIQVSRSGFCAISDICAVLVTYHADQDFSKRLAMVLPQVGHAVIVDNGSTPEEVARLKALESPQVSLVLNSKNQGLAIAINQGVSAAEELGFTWVFTLDHDTTLLPNCIENMLKTLKAYPMADRVGVVGSNYQNRTTGEYLRAPEGEAPWDEVRAVITSGSLMPLKIFEEVGPYRDDFFIDTLDFEFCARVRWKGYKVLLSRAVGMIHNEGEKSVHRLLFLKMVTHNHSPLRRYYIFRNGFRLIMEYWTRDPKWVLGLSRNLVREVCAILFFENNKLAKLSAALEGLGHGLTGTLGPRG